MLFGREGPPGDGVADEIRSLATPLEDAADLGRLVDRVGNAQLVCIGEASHGTSEYYRWRALLSRRLIEERSYRWIGVEGDWPDCWRINRWVRGLADEQLDAVQVLNRFERWPTWMWANTDVADFLGWLREHNLARPEAERVGFYGLDVYSLWDSLWEGHDLARVARAEGTTSGDEGVALLPALRGGPTPVRPQHAPRTQRMRAGCRLPARRGATP